MSDIITTPPAAPDIEFVDGINVDDYCYMMAGTARLAADEADQHGNHQAADVWEGSYRFWLALAGTNV